jgi:hypothetical protein
MHGEGAVHEHDGRGASGVGCVGHMCSFQDSGCGRRARALPDAPDQRSDLNAARISSLKSCGCSQAAKWPPLSTSL